MHNARPNSEYDFGHTLRVLVGHGSHYGAT